jgi:hypothetical protein
MKNSVDKGLIAFELFTKNRYMYSGDQIRQHAFGFIRYALNRAITREELDDAEIWMKDFMAKVDDFIESQDKSKITRTASDCPKLYVRKVKLMAACAEWVSSEDSCALLSNEKKTCVIPTSESKISKEIEDIRRSNGLISFESFIRGRDKLSGAKLKRDAFSFIRGSLNESETHEALDVVEMWAGEFMLQTDSYIEEHRKEMDTPQAQVELYKRKNCLMATGAEWVSSDTHSAAK